KPAADAEPGFECDGALPGRPRLVDPAEPRERRCQYYVGIAEVRIALDRFAPCIRCILVATLVEPWDADAIPRSESGGIERAEPQCLLSPFDRTLRLAGPGRHNGTRSIGVCRGRVQRDRRLEGLARGGAIMLYDADAEPAQGECYGIVATVKDGGMSVADGPLTILFVSARPHEQDFVAVGRIPVSEGVVGLDGERALQQ